MLSAIIGLVTAALFLAGSILLFCAGAWGWEKTQTRSEGDLSIEAEIDLECENLYGHSIAELHAVINDSDSSIVQVLAARKWLGQQIFYPYQDSL